MIIKYFFASLIAIILLTGCSTKKTPFYGGGSAKIEKVDDKKKYSHPTMRPYTILGKRYYPTVVHVGDTFEGVASWYGPGFHGKLTSNGETYDMNDMTAAHKTFPMNTIVKVTNNKNGKNVVVRINDRGPFVDDRIIDMSKTSASMIDMVGHGTTKVKVEVIGFAGKNVKKITDQVIKESSKEDRVVGSFAIQIGSFTRFEGASTYQKRHDKTQGYKTIIKDAQYNGTSIYKVWLTGFRSDEEARDFLKLGLFEHAFIVGE
jgi:rare lipoprotein A